jgi:hypothetical protein
MIPAYSRGAARLGVGNARQALAEFRKFSADAGIVGSCWSAPLVKLGVARAEEMSGSASQAKEEHARILDLWKGADTDLPLLKQAQAEAAKFH